MYINSHTYKKITAHTLSTISQIVYPLQMKEDVLTTTMNAGQQC